MIEQFFDRNRLPEEILATTDLILIYPVPLKSVLVVNPYAYDTKDELLMIPKTRFMSERQIIMAGFYLTHSDDQKTKKYCTDLILGRLIDCLVKDLYIDDSAREISTIFTDVPTSDELFSQRAWQVVKSRLKDENSELAVQRAIELVRIEEREFMLMLLTSNNRLKVKTLWAAQKI